MTLDELVAAYEVPLAVAIALDVAMREHGMTIKRDDVWRAPDRHEVRFEFPRRPGRIEASRALDRVLHAAGMRTWRYNNGRIETGFVLRV